MSPVTAVGISGLVLGDLTFLHLHLQVDPLPAPNSSWARDPRLWVQRHFRGSLQGTHKFQSVHWFRGCVQAQHSLPLRWSASPAACWGLSSEISICPDRICQAAHCRVASLQGHKPPWHTRRTPHLDPSWNRAWTLALGAPFASQGNRDGVSSPQTPRGSGPTPCNH